MIKFYSRLKDFLSIGKDYYHGELFDKSNSIFSLLEKKLITHDEAIVRVKKIFLNNQNLNHELLKFIKKNTFKRVVLGNKLNLFSRINISIKTLKKNQYEPIHFHENVKSFQIILDGQCITSEFEKLKINKSVIEYKKFKPTILNNNELFFTGPNYKDIHGFGSNSEICYILDVAKYSGLLGKSFKTLNNTRVYLDIENEKKIDANTFQCPLFSEKEAYDKYSQL